MRPSWSRGNGDVDRAGHASSRSSAHGWRRYHDDPEGAADPSGQPAVAGPDRGHLDQVPNGGDANRGVAEVDDFRAGPQLVEGDQVLHEEVDLAHGVCGVAGSAKASGSTGARGPKPRPVRGSSAFLTSAGGPGDHQVDVGGQARVPVEHRREPADDHVANLRAVERFEDRFEERHVKTYTRRGPAIAEVSFPAAA